MQAAQTGLPILPRPVPGLVLASASPRRLDLLAQIGLVPERVIDTDIDETPRKAELPPAYVERVARAKAAAARVLLDASALILAADTVVAVGRRLLPKALDEATARRCLDLLSGRRHRVLTAVVLQHPQGCNLRIVESVVAFARLTDAHKQALLDAGDWQGKAGGYAIQGRSAAHIRFLSGSHSNVVGLPLFETAQLLRSRAVIP